ncbi:hypothetical protein Dimus_012299 [Dionaea muscipula]
MVDNFPGALALTEAHLAVTGIPDPFSGLLGGLYSGVGRQVAAGDSPLVYVMFFILLHSLIRRCDLIILAQVLYYGGLLALRKSSFFLLVLLADQRALIGESEAGPFGQEHESDFGHSLERVSRNLRHHGSSPEQLLANADGEFSMIPDSRGGSGGLSSTRSSALRRCRWESGGGGGHGRDGDGEGGGAGNHDR